MPRALCFWAITRGAGNSPNQENYTLEFRCNSRSAKIDGSLLGSDRIRGG